MSSVFVLKDTLERRRSAFFGGIVCVNVASVG